MSKMRYVLLKCLAYWPLDYDRRVTIRGAGAGAGLLAGKLGKRAYRKDQLAVYDVHLRTVVDNCYAGDRHSTTGR